MPLGSIIGGVIGGVIFLLVILIIGWWYYRRYRQSKAGSDDSWAKAELDGSQRKGLHEDAPRLPDIDFRVYETDINEVGELASDGVAELGQGLVELHGEGLAELHQESISPSQVESHSRALEELEEKPATRQVYEMD